MISNTHFKLVKKNHRWLNIYELKITQNRTFLKFSVIIFRKEGLEIEPTSKHKVED